ncbi:hypothetical protein Ate01nite_66390 [Actinoplanes teichomyceticus]|nr:hypothetical protein Ate01nite_66390 [Actinoplanes teichomyceticus]
MDVNGLAGSIELYLGADVLTYPDGGLSPVQWKGYMDKLGKYQGEIVGKRAVQKSFHEKLKRARSDREVMTMQDWSGLTQILNHIVRP